MRLYYFTSADYGLQAIRKRRLKVARISELNDPFELLVWSMRDRGQRQKMRDWKAQSNNDLGLLCLSTRWSNPLLWGHYGDKHKGMALGLEVDSPDLLFKVDYVPRRMPFPVGRELDETDLKTILTTKFSAWKYETEHRVFCRLSDCIKEGALFFEPFAETFKLREVIIGDQCVKSRAEVKAALGKHAEGVEAFKARPAFGSFRVVRNRDASLWQ